MCLGLGFRYHGVVGFIEEMELGYSLGWLFSLLHILRNSIVYLVISKVLQMTFILPGARRCAVSP